MVARHIIVSGKVQGVFFRKNTKLKAEEFNLCGWVKNTSDNKVEIFAQGNEKNLIIFSDWCMQGPPKAKVKKVDVTETQPDKSLNDFSIVYED